MYPVPIEHYYRPQTIQEASDLANSVDGEAFFIAGGMSLMQAVKSRLIAPDCLIDLNSVEELRGISTDNGEIRIGAMTRYREIAGYADSIAPYQALSDAATHVGDRQVRNRGTLGGSLSWNYVSACSPAATLACGAKLEILRGDGNHETIEISEFLVSPMVTALEQGDLLTKVILPEHEGKGGSAYKKWAIVKDAVPIVGVAVFLGLDSSGKCNSARFVVGGLDDGPQRSSAAEDLLTDGCDIADPSSLARCADAAADEISTSDDHRVSAAYKSQLIRQLGTEMLVTASERARA